MRLADMTDDRYDFEEEKYCVRGHDSGRIYRMGQSVQVQVVRADKLTGTIDFVMMNEVTEQ